MSSVLTWIRHSFCKSERRRSLATFVVAVILSPASFAETETCKMVLVDDYFHLNLGNPSRLAYWHVEECGGGEDAIHGGERMARPVRPFSSLYLVTEESPLGSEKKVIWYNTSPWPAEGLASGTIAVLNREVFLVTFDSSTGHIGFLKAFVIRRKGDYNQFEVPISAILSSTLSPKMYYLSTRQVRWEVGREYFEPGDVALDAMPTSGGLLITLSKRSGIRVYKTFYFVPEAEGGCAAWYRVDMESWERRELPGKKSKNREVENGKQSVRRKDDPWSEVAAYGASLSAARVVGGECRDKPLD